MCGWRDSIVVAGALVFQSGRTRDRFSIIDVVVVRIVTEPTSEEALAAVCVADPAVTLIMLAAEYSALIVVVCYSECVRHCLVISVSSVGVDIAIGGAVVLHTGDAGSGC